MKTMNDAMGNLSALRQAIDAGPYDAVIAGSPENVRYTGDVMISTQNAIRDRLAFIVWPSRREPIFVLCRVEEAYVREHSWIGDIRSFKEFVTRPIDLLADILTELGLEHGHVAMELEYLGAKYEHQLLQRLPQLKLAPAEPIFEQVRMYKTAREIAAMQGGFRGTAKAMFATFVTATVGEDEFSLSRRLANGILLSGAQSVAFNHINAGPNTGYPHASPTGYQVQPGDMLKADSGGYYDDYYSNVGRTAKMGKPSAKEIDLWKRLRAIHHEIADMLRPGRTGRELFARATALHAQHDIPFPYAHNGHGIGLSVHEHPLISPHEELAYAPGMVSTVETRVRWVGEAGYHLEDLYLVTEGAPVLLSDAFDNEEILVV
ncbi:MAG: Xaa-Pro peptidase family protein [Pseudomonadota bacterium]